jgi:pyruvate dehydrogenase E1 component alpha subunit/2-oxoisovalerate dehydrogenase E1 component alpha subunit
MNQTRTDLLRWMILARTVDDRAAKLKAQGEVAGSAFVGRGQEALSAATGLHLRRGDVFAPCIRDQAGRLAFGESLLDVARTILGRRTGPMRGRDGNIHRGDWGLGILPFISHLGAMAAPVAGVLLSRRLQGKARAGDLDVGVVSLGDGAMNTGAIHEALNLAAVERLPFVMLVANNQYAYSTTNDRSFACAHLADRAAGYGFAAHRCDGTDADACLATVGAAIAAARAGQGPQLVVADLLRLAGHGTHDDASYVPEDMKSRYGDCIKQFERTLVVERVLEQAAITRLQEDARREVDAAVAQAMAEPPPDPAQEDWSAYAERDLRRLRQ